MCKHTSPYETFQEIAIGVFETRNLTAVASLKKLLAVLPSSACIGHVLLEAIYQLAEQDPDLGGWVLSHRCALEPELNLLELAQGIVLEQLGSQGLVVNRDFSFGSEGQLEVSDCIKAILLQAIVLREISEGNRFLLQIIL